MYSAKVMDHFEHPRNVGEIEDASGVGTVGNAKCGDIMRIYLDIDENQIIKDVKFKTFGCGAAVVDLNRCIGCGLCTTKCNFDAIHIGDVRSEVRLLGSDTEAGCILLTSLSPVKNGSRIY